MKQLKKYLFIPLLFIIPNIYAQLSEFMVQSYFNQNYTDSIDNSVDSFINFKKYHINNIFFDVVSKGCYGIYKLANEAGLKTVVSDYWARRDSYYSNNSSDKSILDTLSKIDYNVMGYCITDEPSRPVYDTGTINLLEYIPPFTNLIRNYNPSLLRYATMLYFYPDDKPYMEDYIQKYINTAKPNLLSFDNHPMFNFNNALFKTLYTFGIKSSTNSIPFIYVLTTLKDSTGPGKLNHTQFPEALSLSKIRYLISAALTYGAKGISYWPCFDHLYRSYINFDPGVKNSISSLHEKLINKSDILLSLNFASVYHVNNTSTIEGINCEDIHEFCKWQYFQTDSFAIKIFSNTSTPITNSNNNIVPDELVISFMTNSSGKIYYWVFNKSVSQVKTLKMNAIKQPYDILNNTLLNNSGGFYSIVLQPGEAKLFTPQDNTTTIPDLTISNTLALGSNYDFELANNIKISNTIFNDVTKGFMGNHIILRTGTKIKNGCTVRLKAYNDSNTNPQSGSILRSSPLLVSVDEDKKDEKLTTEPKLYPNPTANNFKINLVLEKNETIEIRVYDTMGKIIHTVQAINGETCLSLQQQPTGIYFVRLNMNGKLYSYKIIKL